MTTWIVHLYVLHGRTVSIIRALPDWLNAVTADHIGTKPTVIIVSEPRNEFLDSRKNGQSYTLFRIKEFRLCASQLSYWRCHNTWWRGLVGRIYAETAVVGVDALTTTCFRPPPGLFLFWIEYEYAHVEYKYINAPSTSLFTGLRHCTIFAAVSGAAMTRVTIELMSFFFFIQP